MIGSFKGALCLCDWTYRKKRTDIDQRIQKGLQATYKKESSPVIEKTKSQLQEYFDAERSSFDIPLCLVGSAFQKEVWQKVILIPFGKTLSYLELSQQLQNPKAIRAVAAANGANAISIIVPCHRIVGSDGSLTGYAGGLQAKKSLLQLEQSLPGSDQMSLFE